MTWTIKDLLNIPLAEVTIEQPLEGTVKVAMPVKQHEKYGESQFLVIEDGTGEIAVDYKQSGKAPLSPIEKGDKVRIQAQEYKGKLSGAKKETYEAKDRTKKAKITVYGNRLTNLTRSAPPTAPAASGPGGSVGMPAAALSAGPRLTETEAILLWERAYKRALDFADKPEAARCASTILSGALAGMLALPALPPTTAAATHAPEPPENDAPPYDDDDIPFSVLLPFLLPLLYHLLSQGGFA